MPFSSLWRYIPAKIQTLICNIVVWHYCSFSHSNIQLLLFNIVHSLFNVHISNATWLRCKMRYAPNAIQHPCFLHSQSMPLFCFQISSFNMQHSCLSMQFWYSVYGCCCAECNMLVTRSNILVWTLNFTVEWPDWPWVGRPLDKVCGLKIIGRLFETRTATGSEHFACWETIVSQVGKKYLVMWMRLSEGELKVKTAHFRLPSASQKRACLSPLLHEVSPSFQMFQVTQWWWIVVPLGKRLRTTRRPHFVALQSNC